MAHTDHTPTSRSKQAGTGRRRLERFNGPLPDEMPAVEEWDNPALQRRRDDFNDRIALRRARIKGAATGKQVKRSAIIARDKSTCWICRSVVEPGDIHLDHVIPLSKGGKHEPENVKVACSSCNMWKGNRIVQVSA